MGKLEPELTPEQAANAIVDGVERNTRHVVNPFMMRLTLWNHALFPWALQWLMTKTGYRRI
jgi:hypothetical protein